MAPTLHCVRHAQGFHNLNIANHVIPDPLLTPHGETQCRNLLVNFPYHSQIDLIVASPLRRTIYTALLAFEKPIREKGLKIIALPEIQETSDVPCDIGSDLEDLAREVEEKGLPVDLSLVVKGWNSKAGKFAPNAEALTGRAREARQWFKARPEKEIVMVSHGGFLHYFTEEWQDSTLYTVTKMKPSPNNYTNVRPSPTYPGTGWSNTEFRTFEFSTTIDKDDLYGRPIEGDNSSMQETLESRKRRGKTGEQASREVQKQLFVQAMSGWENQFMTLLEKEAKKETVIEKVNGEEMEKVEVKEEIQVVQV
ncbi:hypothetical protein AJ80_04128 [Polytolypa hystricis UAMH7299]|uniref:Phosphoglycerate mutase n=1 Tax=Polytolypa hystricis (strain UAMH7299) TaxID=1447883 RepID=A0A2B7YEF6_POLH7|nr:hypothetical protein AJ80_04128 [Polytolypa hystricis UAMH7299]